MTAKPFHLAATDQRSLVKLSLLCKPEKKAVEK